MYKNVMVQVPFFASRRKDGGFSNSLSLDLLKIERA
jgi:hypothetical protein